MARSRMAVVGWLAVAVTFVGSQSACHRGYYRKQADAEAAALIAAKANHPHWALPRISIDVDPRSRMFDPFDPDLGDHIFVVEENVS